MFFISSLQLFHTFTPLVVMQCCLMFVHAANNIKIGRPFINPYLHLLTVCGSDRIHDRQIPSPNVAIDLCGIFRICSLLIPPYSDTLHDTRVSQTDIRPIWMIGRRICGKAISFLSLPRWMDRHLVLSQITVFKVSGRLKEVYLSVGLPCHFAWGAEWLKWP